LPVRPLDISGPQLLQKRVDDFIRHALLHDMPPCEKRQVIDDGRRQLLRTSDVESRAVISKWDDAVLSKKSLWNER
jgi:hypothetical protein